MSYPPALIIPPCADAKVLVLVCCAPCACAATEALAFSKINATLLFYNPNIQPCGEYEIRRDEVARLAEIYHLGFAEGPYTPEAWAEVTLGMLDLPERSQRCVACFDLRMHYAAQFAVSHGFNVLSSVLGFSRWKSASMADTALREATATVPGLTPWFINWRKEGRQERNAQLLREHQFYNQLYCGCLPSIQHAINR